MPDSSRDGSKPARRSEAGSLAIVMARLLNKALAESLAPLDLAPAQLMVLRELWRQDVRTQRDLAQVLEVEQATMSNTLKRMTRDGLVRHEPHPDDSRARRIRLTERGVLLQEPAKAARQHVHALAFGRLTRKEQKRFVRLSQQVIAALKGDGTVSSGASDVSSHP